MASNIKFNNEKSNIEENPDWKPIENHELFIFEKIIEESGGNRKEINAWKKKMNMYKPSNKTKSGKIMMSDKEVREKLSSLNDNGEGEDNVGGYSITYKIECMFCGFLMPVEKSTSNQLVQLQEDMKELGTFCRICPSCSKSAKKEYQDLIKDKKNDNNKPVLAYAIQEAETNKEKEKHIITIPFFEKYERIKYLPDTIVQCAMFRCKEIKKDHDKDIQYQLNITFKDGIPHFIQKYDSCLDVYSFLKCLTQNEATYEDLLKIGDFIGKLKIEETDIEL